MKSSFSGKLGNCLDVETFDGDMSGTMIRLTETDPSWVGTNILGQTIYASKDSFKAFIDGVKAGEFDHFVE